MELEDAGKPAMRCKAQNCTGPSQNEYIGVILGLYWGYIRVILGLHQGYIGVIKGLGFRA